MSRNFKKLLIWQKSMDLAGDVYQLTATLPDHEKYGMISQINRSCVSIPSNIAEGAGRNSPKEFSNFLSIANGSSNELETLLLLAVRFDYINKTQLDGLQNKINEIQRMLNSLRKTNNLLKPTPTP